MCSNTNAAVCPAMENTNHSVASVSNQINNSPVQNGHIAQRVSSLGHDGQEGDLKGRDENPEISNTTTPAPRSAQKIRTQAQDTTKSVLRALGLTIIAHAFRSAFRPLRHITGRGLHEPTKKAIRESRTVALLRCLIHLFPVSVALFEIILNWNTYYVGVSIYNQAVYQLVAKIHEVAIQASLATVVFSYIRHEMTIGNGIPFGTLFSGLQINQIAYLWSMEFWGSLRSPHLPLARKIALLLLIFVSIVLASLSGPSSAVLLIPRLDFWPGGSTDIWINATMDDLYPTSIDRTLVPDGCFFAPEDGISNGCPSSEWDKIREDFALSDRILPVEYQFTYFTSINPLATDISGRSSQRQLYFGSGVGPIWISTAQQVAVADALTTTSSYWSLGLYNVTARGDHGLPLSDQSNSIHTLTGDNHQPFSVGYCQLDSIQNDTDTRPLALPFLQDVNDPATANVNITLQEGIVRQAIVLPGVSRADIMSNPGNSSQYRLQWVELPQPQFKGSSVGAIVTLPRPVSNLTKPQDIILCNFGAGWGTTTLQMQQLAGGFGSVSSQILGAQNSNPRGAYQRTPENINNLVFWEYNSFPQRPTNITQEWAQYLDPIVRSANRSVFDLIMQDFVPFTDPDDSLRLAARVGSVLVELIANGLARIGFESTLQGSPKSVKSADGTSWIDGNYWVSGKGSMFEVDPTQSKDWLKFHVNSTLEGYAYNMETVAPRFAIGIITLYCVIALGHLFYSGISGISSTCWDSIAEVTALAMNSTPTTALRNTCAGITELYIFQLPVRVLAHRDQEGDGEHLELVFGSVSGEEKDGKLIKANRVYGTMPLAKRHG